MRSTGPMSSRRSTRCASSSGLAWSWPTAWSRSATTRTICWRCTEWPTKTARRSRTSWGSPRWRPRSTPRIPTRRPTRLSRSGSTRSATSSASSTPRTRTTRRPRRSRRGRQAERRGRGAARHHRAAPGPRRAGRGGPAHPVRAAAHRHPDRRGHQDHGLKDDEDDPQHDPALRAGLRRAPNMVELAVKDYLTLTGGLRPSCSAARRTSSESSPEPPRATGCPTRGPRRSPPAIPRSRAARAKAAACRGWVADPNVNYAIPNKDE
jgi:hypothetical protein